MEKIFKRVKFEDNKDYQFDIQLTVDVESLGDFEVLTLPERNLHVSGKTDSTTLSNQLSVSSATTYDYNLPNNFTYTVTGKTASRLDEIKIPSTTRKFINDPNIVLDVTGEYVKYKLDGITYQTFLNDNQTTFFIVDKTYQSENYSNIYFIQGEEFILYHRETVIIDNVDIDRNNISVIDKHIDLKQINNLFQLSIYGGGKYTIVDNN